ncbi:MAG: hypothetical protein K6U75_13565 [Firmicutes bacterium]|nr:hypothetical protein [Bacillota bacterium]
MKTRLAASRLRPAIIISWVLAFMLVLTPARAIVTGGDVWSVVVGKAASLPEIGCPVVKDEAWAYGFTSGGGCAIEQQRGYAVSGVAGWSAGSPLRGGGMRRGSVAVLGEPSFWVY